jgi:hypothetical protein
MIDDLADLDCLLSTANAFVEPAELGKAFS